MNITYIENIVRLRECVAYLGEKTQNNWWGSTFLSPSGKAFLSPVFPKSTLLAQLAGATEAAKKVHDEYIGVGDVIHLFRLPEYIEHDVVEFLADSNVIDIPSDQESAKLSLKELAIGQTVTGVGPLLIEAELDSDNWVAHVASAYLNGFASGDKVFPYFRGDI